MGMGSGIRFIGLNAYPTTTAAHPGVKRNPRVPVRRVQRVPLRLESPRPPLEPPESPSQRAPPSLESPIPGTKRPTREA